MADLRILVLFLPLFTATLTHGSFIKQVTEELKENEESFIKSLPGQPSANFSQWSGYLEVGGGRSLFYYLVEVEATSYKEAPLTLWLNGGPGCSSLGNGGLSELGPFYPTVNRIGLQKNPNSWNRVSNMLFLESPAGVGFSYFTNWKDNTVGDDRTASDAFEFLVQFFKKYPKFSEVPLYIGGESYAGHYVPQLADLIVSKGSVFGGKKISFEGFLVGNAWTDAAIDNKGAVDFWWTHAMVSDESYAGVLNYCNFSIVGPLKSSGERANQDYCDYYAFQAFDEMGPISIYDIYTDVCVGYEKYVRHFAKMLSTSGPASLSTRRLVIKSNDLDSCIDDHVERYLNDPVVQKAFHVKGSVKWEGCSDTLDYSREDLLSSVLPVYERLLHSGLRILVFSGDVDAIVPVTGTRDWIRQLKLKVKRQWRPWLHSKQVGGYVTEYENLTFATIREAGHMVPYTQPQRALHLFSSFIAGKPL